MSQTVRNMLWDGLEKILDTRTHRIQSACVRCYINRLIAADSRGLTYIFQEKG